MNALAEMTAAKWDAMTEAEREKSRDLTGLSPQLKDLEDWRVEVVTLEGETKRFYVGRSTGWRPCNLAVSSRRAYGGYPVDMEYKSVKRLYRR